MKSSVKTSIRGNVIKVKSQYSLTFIEKARQLQGKWEKPYWNFPLKNKPYLINALINIYGSCGTLDDIPVVDVILDLDKYPYDSCVRISTLIVAERQSKYDAVQVSEDVLVMQGGFERKGGSTKYPNINPFKNTILKVDNVPVIIAKQAEHLDGITIV